MARSILLMIVILIVLLGVARCDMNHAVDRYPWAALPKPTTSSAAPSCRRSHLWRLRSLWDGRRFIGFVRRQ